MEKIGEPTCEKKVKLVIWIGCPPGYPRPEDIADMVGMEWSVGTAAGDILKQTARFFGDWKFEKSYCDLEQAKRDGRDFFEKLKKYYPKTIRFASWDIEEEK